MGRESWPDGGGDGGARSACTGAVALSLLCLMVVLLPARFALTLLAARDALSGEKVNDDRRSRRMGGGVGCEFHKMNSGAEYTDGMAFYL